MSDKRSFTIEDSEVPVPGSTRFISSSPSGAAAKAARRVFKEIKNAKKTEVRLTLRETTQGSAGKSFRYIGIKEKLDEPKVVAINGSSITYTHSYKVKSCNIPNSSY
jgi:hypothetical protein